MILPKTSLSKIERGKFEKIVGGLAASGFTGYIKVAYRKNELSSGEVLFDSGKIVAVEITRIKSKSTLSGDAALSELMTLESSVIEIYPLSPEQVRKSIETNPLAIVRSAPKFEEVATTAAREEIEKLDRTKIMEKYGILPPDNGEIRKIIKNSIGNSELASEIEESLKTSKVASEEQERILQKYGIRKPSDEEIEFLISNALGFEESVDFSTLKKELIELLTSKLGKPSRKAVSIIESCNSYEELIEKREELEKSLRALVMFIPREKINLIISDIEEKLGRKLT